MANKSNRSTWKVWRTALTGLADADWADDVSDALPTTGLRTIPFESRGGGSGPVAVEFIVLAYVNATGLLVDLAGETFSCEATELVTPPAATSNVLGRTASGEQIAVANVNTAGLLFNRKYRLACDGADSLTLRLHTLSGAPVGADRYEVWYREVYQ